MTKYEKCEHEWEIERKRVTDEIINWIHDRPNFSDNIKNLIHETRQLKKLPTMTLDDMTERKTTPNRIGGPAAE